MDLVKSICDEWRGPLFPPISLKADSHPIEFFELFMPIELVEDLVKYTVSYAASKNQRLTLSVQEMYVFLGILYVSGYNVLPRRRMYWEEKEDVQNRLISNSMRRKTFEDIFRNLHIVDNTDLDKGDRMAKVRSLIDKMNELFLKYAPIEQSLAIDESMIPYFGRHGCKQFIRGKPIRFGFKAWVLATRLGYCVQFNLYQGRRHDTSPQYGLGESLQKYFKMLMFNFLYISIIFLHLLNFLPY